MPEYYVTARVMLFKDDKRTKEYPLDSKEYRKLHAEMHARGYVRYVIDDSSQVMYRLPPGEYNLEISAMDAVSARTEALSLACAAATSSTSKHRYLTYVTGDGGRIWAQLGTFKKDPDALPDVQP
ncbi:hypothetical protein AB4851_31385 [Burkholderia sp. 22PA0099]|uniref:hypothetical protein n=1 Tax=Burkholderia sp. 22PA0099 TaxID=3237372 RepID=UPI0039C213F4